MATLDELKKIAELKKGGYVKDQNEVGGIAAVRNEARKKLGMPESTVNGKQVKYNVNDAVRNYGGKQTLGAIDQGVRKEIQNIQSSKIRRQKLLQDMWAEANDTDASRIEGMWSPSFDTVEGLEMLSGALDKKIERLTKAGTIENRALSGLQAGLTARMNRNAIPVAGVDTSSSAQQAAAIRENSEELRKLQQNRALVGGMRDDILINDAVSRIDANNDRDVFEQLYQIDTALNSGKLYKWSDQYKALESGMDQRKANRDRIIKYLKDKGYEDPEKLLQYYSMGRNKSAAKDFTKSINNFVREHPVAGSVAETAAAVAINGAEGIVNIAGKAFGNTGFNAPQLLSTASSEMTKAVADGIERSFPGAKGKFFSFVYNAGVSAAESALIMGTMGGGLGELIMGTNAATAAYDEGISKGLSGAQAFATAFAAGLFETAMEHIGWEKIKFLSSAGKSGPVKSIKDFLVSAGTEGSEEVLTDLANEMADYLINGGLSEYELAKASGLSDAQYFARLGLQLAESGLAGALSGGMMYMGGRATSGAAKSAIDTAQDIGAGIRIEQTGGIQNVVTEAKATADSTGDKRLQRAAEKTQKAADKKTKTKAGEVYKKVKETYSAGKLYNKTQRTLVSNAINNRIDGLDADAKTKKKYKNVVNQYLNDGMMNDGDVELLRSKDVQGIFEELSDGTEAWVKDLNTQMGSLTLAAKEPAQYGRMKVNKAIEESADDTLRSVREEAGRSLVKGFDAVYDGENVIMGAVAGVTKNGIEVYVDDDGGDVDGQMKKEFFVDPAEGKVSGADYYTNAIYANVDDQMHGRTDDGTYAGAVMENMPVKISVEAANVEISMYDPTVNENVDDYAQWFYDAYKGGKSGLTFKNYLDIYKGDQAWSGAITEAQLIMAHRMGQYDRGVGVGVTHLGEKKLTESQMRERDVLANILYKYNTPVVIVDSLDYIAKNAYLLGKNDMIVVSLDAEGGLIAQAAYHELFHKLEQHSADDAKKLVDEINDIIKRTVGDEGYQKIYDQRADVYSGDALIRSEIAAQYFGSLATLDEEFLAGKMKKDKPFWERVINFLRDVVKDIRAKMENFREDLAVDAALRTSAENAKTVLDKFEKAWTDTFGENVVEVKIAGEAESIEDLPDPVREIAEENELRDNRKLFDDHVKQLKVKNLKSAPQNIDDVIAEYQKAIDIWDELGGDLNSEFLRDWNEKSGTDREFDVFKAQSGYKYNLELATMCKKGVALFEAIDTIVKQRVMEKLNTEVLGMREKQILYDILKEKGHEIPCAICYVEQARQREGIIIKNFLEGNGQEKLGWNQVLTGIEELMDAYGAAFKFETADLSTEKYVPKPPVMTEEQSKAFYRAIVEMANAEIKRANKNAKEKKDLIRKTAPEAISQALNGNVSSNLKIFKVLAFEDQSRFRVRNDDLYSSVATGNIAKSNSAFYSLFNQQGGVSGYKTKQGAVVYWADVLNMKSRSDTVRRNGGIRNQRNSDFQMYTFVDKMQFYVDLAARGFYSHEYTKVPADLKLFGLNKGKINASLIGRVHEFKNADGTVDVEKTMENAGLDENGEPIYDDVEGMNHEEAFMICGIEEYSKNCGPICIGYSDNHIRKLLADDRISMIIGFHDKTDNPDKRYRGARYAKNYRGLNEAKDLEGKTVAVNFSTYLEAAEKLFGKKHDGKAVYNGKAYSWDDVPRLAARMYLDDCDGVKYSSPAYEEFAKEPNYYKLLADFRVYDINGHYCPHEKVQVKLPDYVPILNNGVKSVMKTKEYIKTELQKELAERDSIAQDLADQSEDGIIQMFIRRVNDGEIKRDSVKITAAQDAEYMQAVENGDLETAHRMVDEAAKAAGYDSPLLYHGTKQFGFTEYDLEKLDDKRSIFATSKSEVAGTYSGTKEVRSISDASKNISKLHEKEIAKALNDYVSKNGDALDSKYVFVPAEEARNITKKADSSLKELAELTKTKIAEYADKMAEDFNDTDQKTHKLLVDLQERLYTGERSNVLTNLYILINKTDVFKNTSAGKILYDLTLAREIDKKKINVENGVFIRNELDGYVLVPLTSDEARNILADYYSRGIYGLYARLGNTLDINAENQIWNDIHSWRNALHYNTNNTTVREENYSYTLFDGNGNALTEIQLRPDVAYEYGEGNIHKLLLNKANGITAIQAENLRTTRDIAKFAKDRGYDSVIFRGLNDNGGAAINEDTDGLTSDVYIVFEPTRMKSADPVTYDDNGSVIPLSERFNENESDIRYSEKLFADPESRIEQLSAENAEVRQQVDAMQDLIDQLQADIKKERLDKIETRGLMPQKTAIQKIAAEFNFDISPYSNAQIAEALENIYWMALNAGDARAETIMANLYKLVDNVFSGSYYVDNDISDTYKDFRIDLRHPVVLVNQDVWNFLVEEYSGVSNLRKAVRGKMRIRKADGKNEGVMLSDFYAGMADTYTGLLDPETDVYHQVYALLAAYEATQPRIVDYKDELGYAHDAVGYDEFITEQAADLFGKLATATPRRTFADKYVEKIKEAREEAKEERQKLADIKKAVNGSEKSLRDISGRLREYYENKLQDYRDKRQETELKQNAIRNISRKVKSLNNRIFRETTQRNVKEDLKQVVVPLVRIFLNEKRGGVYDYEGMTFVDNQGNSTIFSKAELDRLTQFYDGLRYDQNDTEREEDKPFEGFYSPDVANELKYLKDHIEGKRLSSLTSDELRRIEMVVDNISWMVAHADEEFVNGKKIKIDQQATAFRWQAKDPNRPKIRDRTKYSKIADMYYKMLTPVYFFKEEIGGIFSEFFEDFRNAQDNWFTRVSDAKDYISGIKTKHNYDDWSDQTITFEFSDGTTHDFTVEEVLQIYATAKREDVLRKSMETEHLFKGGIVFDKEALKQAEKTARKRMKNSDDPNAKNILQRDINAIMEGVKYNPTIEDIQRLVAELTDEQKKYADDIVKYMSSTVSGWGNATSREIYGIDTFKETYYFPFRSGANYIYNSGVQTDETRLRNMGFTKSLTHKANTPLIITGFTQIAAEHINDMATYSTFTVPVENITRFYNYKMDDGNTVAAVMQGAYGKAAQSYYLNFIKAVNGGMRPDSTASLINRFTSMFKRSAVQANLQVVIQQPTALMRSMAMIEPKYWLGKATKKDYEDMMTHAPIAGVKMMGGFDVGSKGGAAEWMNDGRFRNTKAGKFFDKAGEIEGWGAEKADAVAWTNLWNASKRKAKAENTFTSEAEMYKKAYQIFRDVIDYTQVYDSTLSKNEFLRSKNEFVKLLTAFQAEPSLSFNLLFASGKNRRINTGRALTAFTFNVIVNSLFKAITQAARDTNDDESYWEKYISRVLGNMTGDFGLDGDFSPLMMIPYVKDVMSILQGFSVERSDVSVFADVVAALTKFEKIGIENAGAADWAILAGELSKLTPVPLNSIVKDAIGFTNLFFGDHDKKFTQDALKWSLRAQYRGNDTNEKAYKAYKAAMNNDTETIRRMTAVAESKVTSYEEKGYSHEEAVRHAQSDSDKAYHSKIVEGLVAYDKDVMEAAEARYAGDLPKYESYGELLAKKGFAQNDVIAAISKAVEGMRPEELKDVSETKDKILYDNDDLKDALDAGNYQNAEHIEDYMIENGKSESSVNTTVKNWVWDSYDAGKISLSEARKLLKEQAGMTDDSIDKAVKTKITEMYNAGLIDRKTAINSYVKYAGVAQEDAELAADYNAWRMKVGENKWPDITQTTYALYYSEGLEGKGISFDQWAEYQHGTKHLSTKEEKMQVIDAMDLTNAQKDALYLTGWAESRIYEAPWR